MFYHLKITDRDVRNGYFVPKVEMKNYNFMINGKNFFDQTIKNDKIIYDNIQKIATGEDDEYTTGCLLDYIKENYKLVAIDLSKQQKLDDDPKAMQQINFARNLDSDCNTQMFLIIKEVKETVLDFSKVAVKLLYF